MGVVYVSVMCCNKIKPVGITRRTARWLLINCLAVLLFGDVRRMSNFSNHGGLPAQRKMSGEEAINDYA